MVRNYQPDPLPHPVLSRIAKAGLRAPSAGNSQGIALVVVTEQSLRSQIAQLAQEPEYLAAGFDPWISGAPAHIVLCVSERLYHQRYQEADKLNQEGQEIEWPVPFWWVDAGAVLMSILLATVDEGLSAGFLGIHSIGDLHQLLGIPEHYSPVGVITVGYPAPDRRSASLARGKRPAQETIHWERWGGSSQSSTEDFPEPPLIGSLAKP